MDARAVPASNITSVDARSNVARRRKNPNGNPFRGVSDRSTTDGATGIPFGTNPDRGDDSTRRSVVVRPLRGIFFAHGVVDSILSVVTLARFPAFLLAFALFAAACTSSPESSAPNVATTPPTVSGSPEADEPSGDEPATTTVPPTTTTTLPTIELITSVGFGQLLIEGAEPGATIDLLTEDGLLVATSTMESDGAGFFRDLPSGSLIPTVVERGEPVAVGSVVTLPDATPPPQTFYAGQELSTGFGYLETRDGTTLSVFVTLPGAPANGPYPTLVEYSGYSPSNPGLDEPTRALIPALGYALVQVNVRGTGCSGGSFDAFEPIQDLDGYDVIETVAAQDWAANVGMWGISYPAIMQLHVAATRPPSLAAIAPLSPLDRIESVLYPGGIFNEGFGEEWTLRVGDRAEAFGQSWTRTRSEAGDTTCEANQSLRRFNPDFVAALADNSDRSDRWDTRSTEPTAGLIDVPVFIAGAWQDEQTGGRFPALLDELSNAPVLRATLYNGLHTDPLGPNVLPRIVEFYDFYVAERRPGIDAITRFGTEIALGAVFGGPVRLEGNRFDGQSYAASLDAYEAEPAIRVLFEVGANRPALPQASWEASFESWPIAAEPRRWFFDGNGGIDISSPIEPQSSSFTTDPTEGARITAPDLEALWTNRPGWQWEPTDDANRLTFTSAPLTSTLTAVGSASVDLWIAASSADVPDNAAVEASITEIAPDGTETLVQVGWLDLSRRALDSTSTRLRPIPTLTAEDRQPLQQGVSVEARIEILPFAHVFRTGSQIRVTIDAPGGNSARWQFATSSSPTTFDIFTGGDVASSVVLPIVAGLEPPAQRPSCGSLRGQPCRPLG